MNVDKLRRLAEQSTIDEFYARVDYSYSCEKEFQKLGMYKQQRTNFLNEFEIPSDNCDLIFRTFNQINYFYAQRQNTNNRIECALEFLHESNRLLLFKQDKASGIRTREIKYGVRVELDIFDVRRRYNALLGMPVSLISKGLENWSQAVVHSSRRVNIAILLALALIAIHPFSDANGRLARLTFAWLADVWGLPKKFLKEAQDGEFLRTGYGIESTEYKMRLAIGVLCGNYNVITPGEYEEHEVERGQLMLSALKSSLDKLVYEPGALLDQKNVSELLSHYTADGHITEESQHFLCLDL